MASGPSRLERDYLVVVVDERADARVTVVLVERDEPGVGDGLRDAERAGTEVTDRGVVTDGLVELVGVALRVFRLRDSLRPGAVGDQFQPVVLVPRELRRRFERVREAAAVGVRSVAGEDHDCYLCRRDYLYTALVQNATAAVCPERRLDAVTCYSRRRTPAAVAPAYEPPMAFRAARCAR